MQRTSRRTLVLLAVLVAAAGCKQGRVPPPAVQTAVVPVQENAPPARPASRSPTEDLLGKHELPHLSDAVNRPLTAPLPRKLTYKGLRFTITKGTIGDAPPPGKTRRADADHYYAYLNVSIHNERESTTFYGISPALIKLQIDTDEFGSPLTDDWSLELKPRATDKVTLVFAVPKNASWKRALVVVSQTREEPAILALDGPIPAPRYPHALALPTETELKGGDFVCKLSSITLDVEHEGRRIPRGQRYVKLAGSVTYQGQAFSTGFFGDRKFRLLVADKPAEAVAYPIETLSPKVARAFEAVYVIAADARTVEFQLRGKDDQATSITLATPPAQP